MFKSSLIESGNGIGRRLLLVTISALLVIATLVIIPGDAYGTEDQDSSVSTTSEPLAPDATVSATTVPATTIPETSTTTVAAEPAPVTESTTTTSTVVTAEPAPVETTTTTVVTAEPAPVETATTTSTVVDEEPIPVETATTTTKPPVGEPALELLSVEEPEPQASILAVDPLLYDPVGNELVLLWSWQPSDNTWENGLATGYTEGETAPIRIGVDSPVDAKRWFNICIEVAAGQGKYAFTGFEPWGTTYSSDLFSPIDMMPPLTGPTSDTFNGVGLTIDQVDFGGLGAGGCNANELNALVYYTMAPTVIPIEGFTGAIVFGAHIAEPGDPLPSGLPDATVPDQKGASSILGNFQIRGADGVTGNKTLPFMGALIEAVTPSILIEKGTNLQDADIAPGPSIAVTDPVNWVYVVTNTSTVPLENVVVTDDQGVTPVFTSGDTNTDGLLDPTETWIYQATGAATAGQYANIGSVEGTYTDIVTTDTDPSHYFGVDSGIDIEKETNGQNADTAPGPYVVVGGDVFWVYSVTNTGNVPLGDIVVTDDQPGVVPVYFDGDTNTDGLLDLTETWIYQAQGVATAGQYENTGTVTSTDPAGGTPTDSDLSHYFGLTTGIDIEKGTSGNVAGPFDDADTPTGPFIAVGDPAFWEYEVTNLGNTLITDITVIDSDALVTVDCLGQTTLAAFASMTCTATATATADQYTNIGEVDGVSTGNGAVTDTDPSHYFGVDAQIAIDKVTNGADGLDIPVGTAITWTYTVTNPGNVPISNVTVDDDIQGSAGSPDSGDTNGDDILDTTETWIFTIGGTAGAGPYNNVGTADGDYDTAPVTDTDDSSYTGLVAEILIVKEVSDSASGPWDDANTAPGIEVPVGDTVYWQYTVTNTGETALTDVLVFDNPAITIDCGGQTTLAVGEPMTCTASATAVAGPFLNTATAGGLSPTAEPVTDTDPANYFGVDAQIAIDKVTNGADGLDIPVGTAVTWTYTVTNPGNVPISNVIVTDDIEGVVPGPDSGDDGDDILQVGETWVYTLDLVGGAVAGQYDNVGTADGDYNAAPVTDTDGSSYFGSDAQIAIDKVTNGTDGSDIPIGTPITWTYTVTNPGNVPISNVVVTDDIEGVVSGPDSGDTNTDGKLDVGETWIYTLDLIGGAVTGQYDNVGTADGDYNAAPVTDSDGSSYFGSDAQIAIDKVTNGTDGSDIPIGTPITWTYTVTNPGNVPIDNVIVSDNKIGIITGPDSGDTNTNGLLDTDETWVYTMAGAAAAGDYTNTGTADGDYLGAPVTDSDDSSYFGSDAQIAIDKVTNGTDGSDIPIGTAITWTYTVTNPGNVPIDNVIVSDNKIGIITGPDSGDTNGDDILDITETWIYTMAGSAVAGDYTNTGTADGDYLGAPVTDTDDSSYFGSDAQIAIDKVTNGTDGSDIPIGTPITWTYTVTNPGNVPISNVVVSDDIEGAIAGPDSGDTNGDDILDVGETWIYLNTGTAAAGQYDNVGSVAGDYNLELVNDSDDSSYFGSDAQIEIDKVTNGSDGLFIPVGDPIMWTYTVTNPGNVPLANIVVDDDIEGIIAGPDSGDTNGDGFLDPTETWIYLNTGTAAPGQYDNQGRVVGDHDLALVTDKDLSSYFGSDPSITLEKAGVLDLGPDGLATPGDVINYTFTVTNTGNVTLTDVTLVDTVGGVAISGGPIPSMAPSAVDTMTFTGTYAITQVDIDAGDHENIATVTGTPPVGDNVTDRDRVIVPIVQGPAISLFKDGVFNDESGDGFAQVGETISYAFTVENTGNVTLTDVTINDLSANVIVVGGPIATMAPGDVDSTTFTGTYVITQPDIDAGTFENCATAAGTPPGEEVQDVTSAESCTTDDLPQSPLIDLVKTGTFNDEDGDGFAQPGETISYAFTVENTGNVTLTDVTLADTVGGVTIMGGPIATMAPGDVDTTTFTGSYVVTQADIDAGTFHNVATVSGTPPGENPPVTDDGDADTPLAQNPGIDLVKNGALDPGGNGQVDPGDIIVYTFTVTNTGNVTLSGPVLTDLSVLGLALTCPWDDDPGYELPVGVENRVNCTANYLVTQADIDAGQVDNCALIEASTPSGTPVDDEDCTTVDEPQDPSIEVIKTAITPEVTEGDTATFEITVTNTGNVTLDDVIVEDVLSPDCDRTFGAIFTPGDTISYECTIDDVTADFVNVAQASGTPPQTGVEPPVPVTDDDDAPVTVILLATLGDTVWNDENQNGIQDNGEKGIEGAIITLTLPDGSTIQTTTDVNGVYLFEDLLPGTYTVEIDLSSIVFDGDLVLTTPGSFEVTLVPGENYADADFGVVAVGSIGDTVWNDVNENGVQDSDEKGVAGVTVRLTLADNSTVDATTDSLGKYLFVELAEGEYIVEIVLDSVTLAAGRDLELVTAGFFAIRVDVASLDALTLLAATDDTELKLTTAGSYSVQLAAGESYLDADFGVVAVLPVTGINTANIAVAALALLLLGAAAVLVTRRKSEDEGDLAA